MIHPSITLKHLETLVRVAQLRSFRRAAEDLGTTQPNVSVRIATLEEVLGCRIFLRDGGRVRLTERGEMIRDQALRVLSEVDKLAEVAGRADLVTGRLRLGVAELVACTWLHAFLRRLAQTYPGIAVELTVDLSRNLDADLARGTLDLVVQNRPFAAPADCTVEIGEEPYDWVAAPGLVTGQGVEVLTGRTILTQPRDTLGFTELETFLTQSDMRSARLAPSSSVASGAQMARDGLGVALLPRALIADDLRTGRLERLEIGWQPAPLSFAARFRGGAQHLADAARIAAEVAKRSDR